MANRRTFLKSIATQVAAAAGASAQGTSGTTAKVVGKQALPAPFDGMVASFIEVTTSGKGSPPHQHAGFVLGYVIEGEFRFQIAGGQEQVLRPGQTFYEPPGAKHVVSGSTHPDKPAKILAVIIAKKDETLTKPL